MAGLVDITNKKYGKLTVKKRAENEGRKVRWLCECECGNTIIVYGADLKQGNIHSCGCIDESKYNKTHHMTEKELNEFNELYEYVKQNVMHYDENTALSRYMTLRLKGLSSGKYIERKDKERTANYSYKTILNTFKYCSFDIQRGVSRNHFKDDEGKFRYILAIVERNISTIHKRIVNIEKHNNELDKMDVTPVNGETQEQFKEYNKKIQKKSTVEMRKKFKDIW